MGPGTANARSVPPRAATVVFPRRSYVVAGSVVSGTWSIKGNAVDLNWFSDAALPSTLIPGP